MIEHMAETQSRTPSKITPKTEQIERTPTNHRDGVSAGTERATDRPRKDSVGSAVTHGPIPTEDGVIVPTPGDPRTEPVATAAQSWVPGRVGPRTIPEDAMAATQEPGKDGQDEVMPGTVLADTAEGLGRVPDVATADPVGEHLARIAQDREDGVPLNDAGQRVDDLGRPLPAAQQVGKISR